MVDQHALRLPDANSHPERIDDQVPIDPATHRPAHDSPRVTTVCSGAGIRGLVRFTRQRLLSTRRSKTVQHPLLHHHPFS